MRYKFSKGNKSKTGMKDSEATKIKKSLALIKYLSNPKNRQKRIEQLKQISNFRKDKTYEEIFGKEKTVEIKEKISLNRKRENGISPNFYLRLVNDLNLKTKCQICKNNNFLEVHHKDKNNKNNNLNNLIILCKSCHSKIHNRIRFIYSFHKPTLNLSAIEVPQGEK